MVITVKGKHTKKELIIIILGALILTCVFFGSSYALNNTTSKTAEYNYFGTSNLELSYVDHGMGNGDVLSLTNAQPKTDQQAMSEDGYRFSVTNVSSNGYFYRIRLVEDVALVNEEHCMSRQLFPQYIRFQFDNFKPQRLSEIESSGYVLHESKDLILPGNSEIHELRIWLDQDTPSDLKDHYHGKIVLEEISNEIYKEYQQGNKIKIGDFSYLVLEDSNSKNAYLKLTAPNPNPFFENDCIDHSETCLFTSKEDLDSLFKGYRNGIEGELKKNTNLHLLRFRIFERTEYLDYIMAIPDLNPENLPFLIYNTKQGTIQMINASSGLDPQMEKNKIQLVIIMHKSLLEKEEEQQDY